MTNTGISRRNFSVGVGILAAGANLVTIPRSEAGTVPADPTLGISHTHAAIHQEITFAAAPARIYQALTTADRFDRVVQLSGVVNSMMKSVSAPVATRIDPRPGGEFALFGGYITGFNLELIPNTRIVQAWRAGSWPAGLFSVAKFALSANGTNTTLIFDHTGFPDEAAEHLANGWHAHYWEPLAKILREG